MYSFQLDIENKISVLLAKFVFLILWILLPYFTNAQPNILLIFSDDLNTRIGPYTGIDDDIAKEKSKKSLTQ
jgi:hypothetical protein